MWPIGFVGIAMILVMVLAGSTLVTGGRRDKAVAEFKTRAAAICAKAKPGNGETDQTTPNVTKNSPSAEDTVAAFTQLLERTKAVRDDPLWEDADVILLEKKPKEWTDADREKIAAYIKANLDLIREIVRLVELGRPVYNLDFAKGYAMEFPQYGDLHGLVRLLAAEAMVLAGESDYVGAARDIVAGMKLSHLVADAPLLISQLVRVRLGGIMCDTVEAYLPGENLPPESIQDLVRAAEAAMDRDAFASSLTGEGMYGLNAFQGIRSGELSAFDNESGDAAGLSLDSFLLRLYASPIARPWLNMDEEEYADTVSRIAEAARLPFYETKPLFDRIDREIQDLSVMRMFSRDLLCTLTQAVDSQAWHEARLDLMRLGLAIEQYHAQNGQYPPTLDAVALALGGTLPLDPFTGQSFVYQPSDDSFTLYSAMGSALDADHRPKPGGDIDENGNIVWRGGRK